MAGTSKLDVGKALEKLRGKESPKTRITQLDEKIDALDDEIQRLRMTNRQLGRKPQTGGPTKGK
jgi:prefoldin subunit 5